MAYDASAAKISHAAEICSPRTRATTPQATAPTRATAVQITIERVLVRVMALPLPQARDRNHVPGPSERYALLQRLGGVAVLAHRGGHAVGVLAPPRLEDQLDGGLADVEV